MEIEFDTPFDPDFPLYTRANAGEVFPEILGPLAWSLVGAGAEEGFRRSFMDDFAALRRPVKPWLVIGRFGGRFHLNMSVIRTVAQRLPGNSAAAADRHYFGDASSRGLPTHVPSRSDRWWALRAAPSTLRTLAAMGRRVADGTDEVAAFVASNRAFLATGPDDQALVARLREMSQGYARPFGLHVTNRGLASSALSLATGALAWRGITGGDALPILSSIPGLESTKPSAALTEIASTVDPSSALGELVLARASLALLGRSTVPGAAELAGRLHGFRTEFGHRGVNEFDPTYLAWEMDPDAVLALLRSMIGETGPSAAPEAPEVRLDPVTSKLVSDARRAVLRSELTKDSIVRFTHEIRRTLFELAERWSDRISRADLTLLTMDELDAVARGGSPPRATMARRRAELDAAATIEPAVWSDGSLSVRAAESAIGRTEILGVAGSTGVARGPVRLCPDPLGDFDQGDVLVAKVTDTAWTPLFVAAAAVVTDVGGVLSHATIVARELGIPAVVDTRIGTVELRDGDMVEVDGGRGVVRLLERRA